MLICTECGKEDEDGLDENRKYHICEECIIDIE